MAAAKAPSKSEVLKNLADGTGLNKKQVSSVLDGLTAIIKKELGKKGPGVFAIPGLVKLKVIRKPATKAKLREIPGVGDAKLERYGMEFVQEIRGSYSGVMGLPLFETVQLLARFGITPA